MVEYPLLIALLPLIGKSSSLLQFRRQFEPLACMSHKVLWFSPPAFQENYESLSVLVGDVCKRGVVTTVSV